MYHRMYQFFVLIFAVFIFSTASAEASSDQLKMKDLLSIVSIDEGKDYIKVDWAAKNEKANFKAFLNEKLIYSGEESEFLAKNLEENYVYTLRIEAFDKKSDLLDVIKIQSSTINPVKNIEKNLNDLPIRTIVNSSNVTIDWEDIEGVSSYEIYNQSKLINIVSDSVFTDKVNPKSVENNYTIVGKKRLEEQEINEINRYFEENNIKLTLKMKEAYYYKTITIEKEIGSIENHLFPKSPFVATTKNKLAATATTKSWDLRYTTFLQDEWIKNPNLVSDYKWFKGDNRGYSASSSSYRTRANLSICFCTAGRSVGLEPSVGTTHGYDTDKKFLASDTASSSGITLSNVNLDNSTKITFRLNHAVGNPLVTALDIDYYMNAEFYSNGNYKLSGSHDQAPHHEVYLKTSNSTSYSAMHQAASKGLGWLAPPMPNNDWTKSNF